jgi:excisionase family DNA binding protein
MKFATFNTVDQTAKILKCNRKTLYLAIAEGRVPVVRLGRALRIPGAWLEKLSATSATGPEAV